VAIDITVVVLTLNEERHIARCLESVRELAKRMVVVDSGSTDQTASIARAMGGEVFVHPFINHASQLNWALQSIAIQSEWIMRLDADEIVTRELAEELRRQLRSVSDTVGGMTVNRRIHFMGRWIRHGDVYPVRTLRIWRTGRGCCENRWMDEHIVVEGDIVPVNADIADINLNNITSWVTKHNLYASREAIDLLLLQEAVEQGETSGRAMSHQASTKRWIKQNVYARLPLGLRSLAYFIYRYVIRLGFLDGWPGLVFHAFQGFWYRFLVDVKVYELRRLMCERHDTLAQVVRAEYGYDIKQ